MILNAPITFISAYSENLKKMLDFIKNVNNESYLKCAPYDQLKDYNVLDNTEVYGIKMGYENIEKTLEFTRKFTLEPPMSFYAKGMMATVDFIFLNGKMTTLRTLNIPDINKVAFDVGYMPNEIYPSDHLSYCADIKLID